MNPITIPYHLVIPTTLSITASCWILFFKLRQANISRRLWISLIAFLGIYTLIISTAIYDDIHKQWDYNKYDLNKDGLFSEAEMTPLQQQAEQALINDVGRNFSIITAVFPALALAIAIYLCMFVISRIKCYRNKSL